MTTSDTQAASSNPATDGPALLTRKEAAQRLSVSVRTVDRLIRARRLRVRRVGRAVRIATPDLNALIARMAINGLPSRIELENNATAKGRLHIRRENAA